jgi:4-hydroxybenzoate polyprenyltransferase/phosphoserine phosphatase
VAPLKALSMPLWLLRSKAHLKERIAAHVELDVTSLPYDIRVLELIDEHRRAGRRVVLVTATHRKFAQQIADHLGVFDEVLSTDGDSNLSGSTKREALVERYGERGFDYVGNSSADVEVWRAAGHAYIANPEAGVTKAASRVSNVAKVIEPRTRWSAYLRLMRPHQWAKNLLIFVPLFLGHQASNVGLLLQALLAFVAFGLTASSVYVLNDLLDLEADRHHVRKRHRPLASGLVSVKHGLVMAPLLLGAALIMALQLPWMFLVTLAVYYILTLAYSLYVKRLVMLDVVTLAGLYTMRILAGAAVTGLPLSFWLLAFSLFLFLSLALVKRYSELMVMKDEGKATAKGRGYQVSDLSMLSSLGAASGYIAVLVMALYINSPDVLRLYHRPELLWLTCPALLFWVGRIWVLAHRGVVHDDPVVFALRDRWSQLMGAFLLVVVLAAT